MLNVLASESASIEIAWSPPNDWTLPDRMKVLESEFLNNIGSESPSVPEVIISPLIVVVLLSLVLRYSPYA